MHEEEPSRQYTLDDLPALTLLEAASHKQTLLEALCGDLDDGILAERVPGELIGSTTTSESPEVRAMCTLADLGDPDTLRHLAFNTLFVDVLRMLAKNPVTPLDALEHVTTFRHWGIAQMAAGNPGVPGWMLGKFYDEGGRAVRRGVMSHPHVPRHLIDRAAADSDAYIRCGAASCTRASVGALTRLSTDSEDQVRACVAGNPATPLHLLDRLAADPAPEVMLGVLTHPAISSEVFDSIVERSVRSTGTWWVLYHAAHSPHLTPGSASLLIDAGMAEGVAENPRTPAGELYDLAHRGGRRVRWNVANNPACPLDLRARLATTDKSRDVRETAAALLPPEQDPRRFATLLDLTPGTIVEVRGYGLADRYRFLIHDVGDVKTIPNRHGDDYLKVTLTGIRRRVNGAPSRRYPGPVTCEVFVDGLRIISTP